MMEGTLKDIERRMITEIIIKHPNWNLDSFSFWISPISFCSRLHCLSNKGSNFLCFLSEMKSHQSNGIRFGSVSTW